MTFDTLVEKTLHLEAKMDVVAAGHQANVELLNALRITQIDQGKVLEQHSASLNALVIGQARLEARVTVLEADVAELKSDVAELKSDVAVLKTGMAVLTSDVARLQSSMARVMTLLEVLLEHAGLPVPAQE